MGSAGTSGDKKMNVYIWDMDETLILLKSLLDGTYAGGFNGMKNVQKGVEIGMMWENHILQICDDYFFYEQIENCNQPYLDVMHEYDDGLNLSGYDFHHDGFGPPLDDVNKRKLAYRHRVIAQKYKKGLYSLIDQDMVKSWDNLYDSTDRYTDGWLSSARVCLEHCAAGNAELISPIDSTHESNHASMGGSDHVNVLVTSGSLIPSLVKCLLFRLDGLVACENVYSSWEVGKLPCFSWIRERFSCPNVQFCVIGDGREECEAAEAMRWPFVKVDPHSSSYYRFPGLTLKDLDLYQSIVYASHDRENKE